MRLPLTFYLSYRRYFSEIFLFLASSYPYYHACDVAYNINPAGYRAVAPTQTQSFSCIPPYLIVRQQQHVTEGHAAALREVTAMAGTWDGLRDAMANSSDPADAARWAAVRDRVAQQVCDAGVTGIATTE